ncbi:MAG: aminomethyl transferase family protein [Halobacteriales archaeon]
MGSESLADVLRSVDNTAMMFRNNDIGWQPYVFREEYTNWIEEQRAVRESVAVVDQSYHMEILEIEGPDAVKLLESLGVNDFDKIRDNDPPRAINYLTCNPDGYVIGDVIVFYLGKNEFLSVGSEWINNWVRYNAEIKNYDVYTNVPYHPFDDHDPPHFRFQIQGPNAMDTMKEVIDGGVPNVSFFGMDTVEINGVETYALGHGMAATPGLEIFGPYHHHDEVLEDIFAAGEEYDIRQLGTRAYKTGKIGSGWFVAAVPAIHEHPDLEGYREWLGADSMEAQLSVGGSFDSDDITDYYMTPMEQGKTGIIDFEHDFVGKEALEEMVGEQERERVTLVWDSDDVVDIYGSLFEEGPTHKYMDMPDVATQWSVCHYDTIYNDGEVVGLSKYPGYLYYTREMLSLATVDLEYSDPGTEVSFVWGDTSGKRKVERHDPVEIDATVAPAPYVRGGREEM